MEQQTVTVTIRTRGENCKLTDEQIKRWYKEQIERLLDPDIGAYEVEVEVARKPYGYRFYGWETADVTDGRGLTPRDYYDLLKQIWCIETCAPRLRKDWSTENMTLGQCSITAFLMQDLYGGSVRGIPLPDGSVHCFNDVNGCVFDLTSEQFGSAALDYANRPEQLRETHFADAGKRERYELLKTRLFEALQ